MHAKKLTALTSWSTPSPSGDSPKSTSPSGCTNNTGGTNHGTGTNGGFSTEYDSPTGANWSRSITSLDPTKTYSVSVNMFKCCNSGDKRDMFFNFNLAGRTGSQTFVGNNNDNNQLMFDFEVTNKSSLNFSGTMQAAAFSGCEQAVGFMLFINVSEVSFVPKPAPTLSKKTGEIVCGTLFNLNSLVTSSTPTGTELVWFTNNTHSGTPYSNPTSATAGDYFAYYFDSANNCFRATSEKVTITFTDSDNNGIPDTCIDTDNDGVADLVDIDDDNDGITDGIESPSCFFEPYEWNTTDKSLHAKISSSLTTTSTQSNFAALTDNNAVTEVVQFSTSPVQNQLDKAVFQVEFTKPIQLDAMYVKLVNTNPLFPNNTMTIEGSNDNSSWTVLSDAIVPILRTRNTSAGGVTLTDSYRFKVTQNAASFKHYRLKGAESANILDGIASEIYFDVNVPKYQVSLFPKKTCSNIASNLDGDTSPNHLDLDSDGDGCSDALEAGATTNQTENFQFTVANNGFIDANRDGLTDTVDADTDGKEDYTLKYYGFDKNTNFCKDTDNDGVKDVDDIDDDNDGVKDIDEGCTFATSSINNEFNGAFGTLAATEASRDLETPPGGGYVFRTLGTREGSYAVITASSAATWHRNWGGLSGHTTGAADDAYLAINGNTNVGIFYSGTFDVTIPTVYQFGFWVKNNEGSTVELGLRVKDVSGNVISDKSTGTLPLVNTAWTNNELIKALPVGTYTYEVYNISIAASGNDFSLDDIHVRPLFNPFCNRDTDKDGFLDAVDLDSDGDGCPDTVESGSSKYSLENGGTATPSSDTYSQGIIKGVTNAILGNSTSTEYGSNGLYSVVETDDTTTSDTKYVSNYEFYALVSAINYCTDFDGDMIPDLDDLDDDNDGVLDAIESAACFFTSNEWNTIDKTLYTRIISSDFITESTNSNFSGLTDNNNTTAAIQFDTNPGQSQNGLNLFLVEFAKPLQLDAMYISKTSATQISGGLVTFDGSNDGSTWKALFTNSDNPLNTPNTTLNGGVLLINSNKFTVAQNKAPYKFYRIRGADAANIGSGIVSEFFFDVTNTEYSASSFPKTTCSIDSDSDSINNHHDLDSDGDNCPDAREASVTGVLLNGNVINNTPNTTTNVENAIAQGPYGTNGLANSLENNDTQAATTSYTSTYIANALNLAISNCFCYKPGITTGSTLPSITGVSDFLGLPNDLKHWISKMPKNGALVIGSHTKGFVITRIASPETVITGNNAIKGMLVFDTAANCLKMYDGTQWFCLTQKCVDN